MPQAEHARGLSYQCICRILLLHSDDPRGPCAGVAPGANELCAGCRVEGCEAILRKHYPSYAKNLPNYS